MFSFLLIVFLVAVTIRACELPLYIETEQEDGHQDFINFWNAVWLVVVTMTTVGFGDFYPRTHFGRLIDALVALAGIFMMSMVIMVINNQFQMNSQEKKVSRITAHMLSRIGYQKECAQVIAHLLKFNMEQMKLESMSRAQGKIRKGDFRKVILSLKSYSDTKDKLVGRLKNLMKMDHSRSKL